MPTRHGTRHRVALARPITFGPRGAGTDSTIPVPGTGTLLIDADTLVVSGNTVLRPRDRIAGAAALEIMDVKNASPAANLYGAVVVANDANFGATVAPKAGALWDVADRAARLLGHVTVDNASLAVTGTFFQATQAVSIAATVTTDLIDSDARIVGRVKLRDSGGAVIDPATKAQLPAALVGGRLDVNIGASGATVPVSGTFWQATQPVSIAGTVTTDPTDRVGRLLGHVIVDAGTAQMGLVKLSDGTDTALISAAGALLVEGATLTKGTQGASGFSTQALKDAGRVQFSCATVIAGVGGVAAEAVLSMVPVRDGVAAAGATTFAVTAGKRLRLTHLVIGFVSTAAAVVSVRVTLRTNPGGAAIVTSPIIFPVALPSGAALAQAGNFTTVAIPDGFEFSGTQQFALSHIGSVATYTLWAALVGFEY